MIIYFTYVLADGFPSNITYENDENVMIPLGEIIRKRLRCIAMNDAVKINIADKGSCTEGGTRRVEGKLSR